MSSVCLTERLAAQRGDTTKFFVFADTVAAQSFSRREDWHGWMGVRFQTEPRGEPSQIIMHVRMWDKENLQQQEALGVLGVNLVYGALYHHDDMDRFLKTLLDDLTVDRVEVDMIKFSGAGVQRRGQPIGHSEARAGWIDQCRHVHCRWRSRASR